MQSRQLLAPRRWYSCNGLMVAALSMAAGIGACAREANEPREREPAPPEEHVPPEEQDEPNLQAQDEAPAPPEQEPAAEEPVAAEETPPEEPETPTLPEPAAPLADLVLSESRTASTFLIGWEFFDEASCAFLEGCLQGTGWRRLLRFATEIQNIGQADVHLGNPVTQPDFFEYDGCHNHYHMLSSMEYRLLDSAGHDLVPGYKQSFCWGDAVPVAGAEGPSTPNFPLSDAGCNENQGLTQGWADVYEATLDCQFLDVTDVLPGVYTFAATVNGEGLIAESDYSNNSIEITVEISPTEPPF